MSCPQLGRDREADLAIARQAREPDAQLLDRLELGGPGRHLLEVLGVLDRDRRLRRERRHRVELVVAPGVRRVVVDVQQAEDVGSVEQRRRADRVVALLDDGRPDVLAARVVAVAAGEQRPAGGDRPATAATGPGTRSTALEVGLRQAAADLGDGRAVRVAQEDRAAVGRRRGPSRGRRGPTGSGRDRAGCRCRRRRGGARRPGGAGGATSVRLAAGDDDRRDADGHVAEEVRVDRGRIAVRAGVDDEHAPRPVVAGDRRPRASPMTADVARRHGRGRASCRPLVGDAGSPGRRPSRHRRVERVADHAEVARQLDEPRRAPAGAGDGVRAARRGARTPRLPGAGHGRGSRWPPRTARRQRSRPSAAIRVSATSRLRSASWRPASTGSRLGAAGGGRRPGATRGRRARRVRRRQQLEPWPAVAAP